ncbi:MAG: glycosyltransferase family 2 protein [Candidatus Omnitrophota bacterium]
MDKMPLVSVITPFYNDIKYFPETLSSYFAQSYPNIEMIVVDDNSDLRPDPIVPAQMKHPVRIIRSQRKLGPGGARNLGIRQALGEFIAFLDSDDIWKPDFVRKCVDVFLKHDAAEWVYTDGYYIIDGKPVTKPNSAYFGFKNGLPKGFEPNEYHLKGYAFELMSANVVRRSAVERAGFFTEGLAISEDWDFFCRVGAGGNVYAVDEPLIYYRKRSDGFHYTRLENYAAVHSAILKKVYESQGLLPGRQEDLGRAIALSYERVGIQYLNKGLPAQARYYLTHEAARPISSSFRMTVLKCLSFMPPVFYKAAIKLYELII